MRSRSSSAYLPWGMAALVLLILVLVVVWNIRSNAGPAQQLALKASRVDLVSRMQVALASSSEAERGAVLALGDEDSRSFADQARAALAEVNRVRAELVPLLAAAGLDRERGLLAQFSEDFAVLERIDQEVLDLAVRNTNVKAYALAYGPAAGLLGEMETALSRLAERHATLPDAQPVALLAARARIGILHIQVLLPPHIAEESSEKMDQLEAAMTAGERQVGQELEQLAAHPSLRSDESLVLARARFASFVELKSRILALSRQNTNLTSLALSLNQQRKKMALCVEALNALQQAVLEEPVAGVTYGRLPVPTR